MMKTILCLVLYLPVWALAKNNPLLISDKLTGNSTRYTQINDSVWSFVNTYYGHVMETGKLVHPKIDELYIVPERNVYQPNKYPKLHDTITRKDVLGKIIRQDYYEYGIFRINLIYFHGYKIREMGYFETYTFVHDFDSTGKLNRSEWIYPQKKKIITTWFKGKKKVENYVYNSKTHRYEMLGKQKAIYDHSNNLIELWDMDKKLKLPIKKTFLDFGKTRSIVEFKYNKRGDIISEKSWSFNDGKKKQESEVVREFDSKGFLLFESRYEADKYAQEQDDPKLAFKYSIKLTDSTQIEYRLEDLVLKLQRMDKIMSLECNMTEENESISAYVDSSRIYSHYYRKKILYQTKLQNFKRYSGLKVNIQTKRSNTLLAEVNHLVKMLTEENKQQRYLHYYYYNPFDYKQKTTTDSFYSQGEITQINIHSDDSVVRYQVLNGQKKLEYHSHYLRIAKDFHLCENGLKGLDGNWVIPPTYDFIHTHGHDTLKFYFCVNGELSSLYSWKGDVILKDVPGIDGYAESDADANYRFWVDNLWKKRFKLKSGSVYLIHYPETKTFCLMDWGNRVLMSWTAENVNWIDNSGLNRTPLFTVRDTFQKTSIYFMDTLLAGPLKQIRAIYFGGYVVSTDTENYFTHSDFKKIEGSEHSTYHHLKSQYYSLKTANGYKVLDIKKGELYKVADLDRVYQTSRHHLEFVKNGHYGLLDYIGMKSTPLIYKRITEINGYFLCKTDSGYHSYNMALDFLGSIEADTLFLYPNKWGKPAKIQSGYSHGGVDFYHYKLNGKSGICDLEFKYVLPAIYDYMGVGEINLCLESNGKRTFYNLRDKKFEEIFPANRALIFADVSQQSAYTIFDYTGKKIDGVYDNAYINRDRYVHTPIYLEKQPVGLMNTLGMWILNLKQYSKIKEVQGNYYFMNEKYKSGLIGPSGDTLVPAAHNYIAYDEFEQLLWFTDRFSFTNQVYSESTRGIWMIQDLRTGKTYENELYWPGRFFNNLRITQDKSKKFGCLLRNPELKELVPFVYDYAKKLTDSIVVFGASTGTCVLNTRSKELRILPYSEIHRFSGHYLALKGQITYMLDEQFTVLDSSNHFFADPKEIEVLNDKYYTWFMTDSRSHAMNLLDPKNKYRDEDDFEVFSFEDEEEEEISDEDRIKAIQKNRAVYNLCRVFYILNQQEYEPGFAGLSHFPEFNYQYNGSFGHDFKALDIKVPGFHLFGGNVNEPMYMSPTSLLESNPELFSYASNTISFEITDYANTESGKAIRNVYVSPGKGIYTFDLYRLIKVGKYSEFNKLVYKYLKKIDNPEVPCHQGTDYMETMNSTFCIHEKSLRLYLNNMEMYFDIPLVTLPKNSTD